MTNLSDRSESKRLAAQKDLIFVARDLDLMRLPRVDCHLHTSWTDGAATVGEVHQRAVDVGLSAILFSEHSRKTSTDWFGQFANEVNGLPNELCRAYVGTECKIESLDGAIDTSSEISDRCDLIMASVHRFPDQYGKAIPFGDVSPDKAVDLEFRLSWAAIANPDVDILGHLFGMSYRRFAAAPPDNLIRSLIARAAEYGVAIEVNSHYHPDPHRLIAWCREFGARITFGSNAHTIESIGAVVRVLNGEDAK